MPAAAAVPRSKKRAGVAAPPGAGAPAAEKAPPKEKKKNKEKQEAVGSGSGHGDPAHVHRAVFIFFICETSDAPVTKK